MFIWSRHFFIFFYFLSLHTWLITQESGIEAFQAAGSVRPGSRFWIEVCECMDRPPLQTTSQESVMYQKEVITLSLVHGLSPEAWIVFFFVCFFSSFFKSYTVQALLCLGKTQTTLYLLTPWTSHSAKFIVGKVECPKEKKKKGFCTPLFLFLIYTYIIYI